MRYRWIVRCYCCCRFGNPIAFGGGRLFVRTRRGICPCRDRRREGWRVRWIVWLGVEMGRCMVDLMMEDRDLVVEWHTVDLVVFVIWQLG